MLTGAYELLRYTSISSAPYCWRCFLRGFSNIIPRGVTRSHAIRCATAALRNRDSCTAHATRVLRYPTPPLPPAHFLFTPPHRHWHCTSRTVAAALLLLPMRSAAPCLRQRRAYTTAARFQQVRYREQRKPDDTVRAAVTLRVTFSRIHLVVTENRPSTTRISHSGFDRFSLAPRYYSACLRHAGMPGARIKAWRYCPASGILSPLVVLRFLFHLHDILPLPPLRQLLPAAFA